MLIALHLDFRHQNHFLCPAAGGPDGHKAMISSRVSYRPDFSGGVGVLPRQAKVQHVALPVRGGKSTHGKVGLWDRSVGGTERRGGGVRGVGRREVERGV